MDGTTSNRTEGMPSLRSEVVKLVGVNERGQRIGEDHQGAVLSDHEVDLVFELHDPDGVNWGYRRIARAMECSKSLIRRILKGEIRNQFPVRYKRV